jgi:hypothetical protein
MANAPKYWFPAKRYGWGWGLPVAWQGWAVVGVWLGAVVAGIVVFEPGTMRHVVFMFAMAAVLTVVCYAKGEPPRWRWGERR